MRPLAFCLLALAACAPTSEAPVSTLPPSAPSASLPPPPSDSGLSGTTWTLAQIGEEPAPAPATLAFSDSTVNGKGGCNGFSGPYSAQSGGVVGPVFSAGPLVSTRMHCGDLQPFESRYFEALEGARRWLVDGDELELAGAGPTLTFQRGD